MAGRRHHFIPRMLLRNFADERGQLFFWRRSFAPREVKRSAPENLFVETDLYSLVDDDGVRNDSLEEYLAAVESTGADLLRQFLEVVRKGGTPSLSTDAWEFWHEFIYLHMKRSPRYMTQVAERSGTKSGVVERLELEAAKDGPTGRLAAETLADPAAVERLYREASLGAIAAEPSKAVLQAFRDVGISVFRAPRSRSFAIGDIGFGRATVDTKLAATGQLTFIPIAPDVAVGFTLQARRVYVHSMKSGDVHRMNMALAAQSQMIAADNEALIHRMSEVRYRGMPAFTDRGGTQG